MTQKFRTPPPIKGVVFDLDGTLVSSMAPTIKAMNAALSAGPGLTLDLQTLASYFGASEWVIFHQILNDRKDSLQLQSADALRLAADRTYSIYRKSFLDELESGGAPLFEGVRALLSAMKNQGHHLGVFTGRGRDLTDEILRYHRLDSVFDVVVTHDDVSKGKPNPEGILKAIEKIQVLKKPDPVLLAQDFLYLGDSWIDIRAAHDARTHSGAALWDPLVQVERVLTEKPEFQFNAPKEIADLLRASHA